MLQLCCVVDLCLCPLVVFLIFRKEEARNKEAGSKE